MRGNLEQEGIVTVEEVQTTKDKPCLLHNLAKCFAQPYA